jgi:hypothetical protein
MPFGHLALQTKELDTQKWNFHGNWRYFGGALELPLLDLIIQHGLVLLLGKGKMLVTPQECWPPDI